jgi:hypothetical protein
MEVLEDMDKERNANNGGEDCWCDMAWVVSVKALC